MPDYDPALLQPEQSFAAPTPEKKRGCGRLAILGCGGLLLAFVLFFSFLFGVIFYSLKNSEPYNHAVAVVNRSPSAAKLLGAPLKMGMFPTGSINVSGGGSSGNAEIQIPVSGPEGEGRVTVVAKKKDGKWAYDTLVLRVKGNEREIDLLQEVDPAGKDF
jgi:hypothetical protein